MRFEQFAPVDVADAATYLRCAPPWQRIPGA